MTTTAWFAADTSIGARDFFLDPTRIGEHLGQLLGAPKLSEATLVRVKYRLHESLRVSYRVTIAGSDARSDAARTVTARTFARGQSAEAYRRAAADAVPVAGAPSVIHDAAHSAVWWVLPNDRRLVGIAQLLEPDAALAAEVGLASWTGTEVAEYSPERSITMRALDRERRVLAYLKLYAPQTVDVAPLATRYQMVASGLDPIEGVSAPKVLHVDARRNLLVLEAMPGTNWGDLSEHEAPDALERLGLAIAHLHRLPLRRRDTGLKPFGRLQPARIRRSAELVGEARPDLAPDLLDLVSELMARRPVLDETCFLHGDCHPKNALAANGTMSLIDLDQAGIGPSASDIGSLMARLRSGTIVGERSLPDEEKLRARFLDGYATVARPPTAEVLRWYTAATLIAERAIRAVNRVQTHVLPHLPEIVRSARATLEGSS